MRRSPFARALLASAAIAAAIALAGCDTDSPGFSSRALAPLSDKMLAEIERKNMTKESPILVRLFKEESELEVWKQDTSGRYALLKTYPICRWSGELGPKIKEGDRQAPEGFYSITPGLMNPNSQYYLAFNLGFPNAYDKANDRHGAFLMVHGDCSSRGCYAMTDEQIAEIYALARESFFGGQTAFQVQAYPFRMTPVNMARHRNNPHMAFWKMIKQGYDHFEVSRLEPKVDVCDRRYVFDAQAPGDPSKPLSFNPRGKCPVYEVDSDLLAAVKAKRHEDEVQTAALISRGTPAAPVTTGLDGGMNPVFLAAIRPKEIRDADGNIRALPAIARVPGTIPAHVVPPGERALTTGTVATADVPVPRASPQRSGEGNFFGRIFSTASSESKPAPAPATRSTKVAAAEAPAESTGSGKLFGNVFSSGEASAAEKTSSESPGVMDKVSRFIGLRGSEPEAKPAAPKTTAKKAAPVKHAAAPTTNAAKPRRETAQPEPKAAPGAIRSTAWPDPPASSKPAKAAEAQPAPNGGLVSGAQPTVPVGSFDSRWSGLR